LGRGKKDGEKEEKTFDTSRKCTESLIKPTITEECRWMGKGVKALESEGRNKGSNIHRNSNLREKNAKSRGKITDLKNGEQRIGEIHKVSKERRGKRTLLLIRPT